MLCEQYYMMAPELNIKEINCEPFISFIINKAFLRLKIKKLNLLCVKLFVSQNPTEAYTGGLCAISSVPHAV